MAWTHTLPVKGDAWDYDQFNDLREAILERKAVAEFVDGAIAGWQDPVTVEKGVKQSLSAVIASFHDCIERLIPRFYVPAAQGIPGNPKHYVTSPHDQWDKWGSHEQAVGKIENLGFGVDWMKAREAPPTRGDPAVNDFLIIEHLCEMRLTLDMMNETDLAALAEAAGGKKQGFSAGPSVNPPPTPYDWKGVSGHSATDSLKHVTYSRSNVSPYNYTFDWNGQDRSMEKRAMYSADIPDLTGCPDVWQVAVGMNWTIAGIGGGRSLGAEVYSDTVAVGAWDYGDLLAGGNIQIAGGGYDAGIMATGDPAPLVEDDTNSLQLRVAVADDQWDVPGQGESLDGGLDLEITTPLIARWTMVYVAAE